VALPSVASRRTCSRFHQDEKPRKVFFLDGSTIAVRVLACPGLRWRVVRAHADHVPLFRAHARARGAPQTLDEKVAKKQQNAFVVTTRTGRQIFLACEEKPEQDVVRVPVCSSSPRLSTTRSCTACAARVHADAAACARCPCL
jgi:hypothetical protein